ncbi:MAG: hypothetical protein IPJ71_15615 [Bdellovibrionales bacterium]|nr:hypothetical protein [Bdellovibrionales bacterium]
MDARSSEYIPQVFRSFQGFNIRDIKEWTKAQRLEIHLEKIKDKEHFCRKCGCQLGRQDGRYRVTAQHMRIMSWSVTVSFWREKRDCASCKKVRSEAIDFISDTTPHVTKDLAFWINRLSEITSVLQVSILDGLDKKTCYKVDKHLLMRFLQGYKMPNVTQISVDEVYARSRKQPEGGRNKG